MFRLPKLARVKPAGLAALLLAVLAPVPAYGQNPPVAPATSTGVAPESDTPVIVGVAINGVDTGEAVWLTVRGNRYLIARTDALRIGLTPPANGAAPRAASGTASRAASGTASHAASGTASRPASGPASGTAMIDLDTLPGLVISYDPAQQLLNIIRQRLGADATVLTIVDAPRAFDEPDRTLTSLLINYDALVQVDRRGHQVAGVIDAAFSRGRATAELSARYDSRARISSGPGARHVVRLDARATVDHYETGTRTVVGDVITRTGSFARPVRLGGLQHATDFAQRPDLVTMALPGLSGTAAVPSGVEVLVNGQRIYAADVDAGDFTLRNIPVVTGRGTVGVVVIDALGRQSLQQLSLYASPSVLAPGLSESSIELGALRYGFGERSNDYRGFALFAAHRRGISQRVTLEGSLQAARGVVAGAGEASVVIGGAGLLTGGIAVSDAHSPAQTPARNGDPPNRFSVRRTGWQWAAGFESYGRPFSIAASVVGVSAAYRDVAAHAGDALPRSRATLTLGLDLGQLGSFSIAGVRLAAQRDDAQRLTPRSRVLSAYYRTQIAGTLDLHASYTRDFDQRGSGRLLVGVTASLGGGRTSIAAAAGVSGGRWDGEAVVQRSPFATGDVGYRASIARGTLARESAGLSLLARQARLDAAVERVGGNTAARFGAAGALVIAQGGVYAARRIDGGFAIVDTGGAPDVTVLHDNRVAGRSNARGRLLVTGLRPYERNVLSVGLDDLRPDITIERLELNVRPRARSGVLAALSVRAVDSFTAILRDAGGRPLPAGSLVTGPDNLATLVGNDGFVMLELTPQRAAARRQFAARSFALRVALATGSCTARITVAGDARPFATVGDFTCLDAASTIASTTADRGSRIADSGNITPLHD